MKSNTKSNQIKIAYFSNAREGYQYGIDLVNGDESISRLSFNIPPKEVYFERNVGKVLKSVTIKRNATKNR